nr:hypothetical protein GCM10020185_04960 [Pseudomonas brassicacearum subsp. brassicacearum]
MAQFGLGSTAFNYTGNIDTLALDGIYMVSNSTTGNKPTIYGTSTTIPNGTIFHMERGSSSMATQIWDSLVSDNVAYMFFSAPKKLSRSLASLATNRDHGHRECGSSLSWCSELQLCGSFHLDKAGWRE